MKMQNTEQQSSSNAGEQTRGAVQTEQATVEGAVTGNSQIDGSGVPQESSPVVQSTAPKDIATLSFESFETKAKKKKACKALKLKQLLALDMNDMATTIRKEESVSDIDLDLSAVVDSPDEDDDKVSKMTQQDEQLRKLKKARNFRTNEFIKAHNLSTVIGKLFPLSHALRLEAETIVTKYIEYVRTYIRHKASSKSRRTCLAKYASSMAELLKLHGQTKCIEEAQKWTQYADKLVESIKGVDFETILKEIASVQALLDDDTQQSAKAYAQTKLDNEIKENQKQQQMESPCNKSKLPATPRTSKAIPAFLKPVDIEMGINEESIITALIQQIDVNPSARPLLSDQEVYLKRLQLATICEIIIENPNLDWSAVMKRDARCSKMSAIYKSQRYRRLAAAVIAVIRSMFANDVAEKVVRCEQIEALIQYTNYCIAMYVHETIRQLDNSFCADAHVYLLIINWLFDFKVKYKLQNSTIFDLSKMVSGYRLRRSIFREMIDMYQSKVDNLTVHRAYSKAWPTYVDANHPEYTSVTQLSTYFFSFAEEQDILPLGQFWKVRYANVVSGRDGMPKYEFYIAGDVKMYEVVKEISQVLSIVKRNDAEHQKAMLYSMMEEAHNKVLSNYMAQSSKNFSLTTFMKDGYMTFREAQVKAQRILNSTKLMTSEQMFKNLMPGYGGASTSRIAQPIRLTRSQVELALNQAFQNNSTLVFQSPNFTISKSAPEKQPEESKSDDEEEPDDNASIHSDNTEDTVIEKEEDIPVLPLTKANLTELEKQTPDSGGISPTTSTYETAKTCITPKVSNNKLVQHEDDVESIEAELYNDRRRLEMQENAEARYGYYSSTSNQGNAILLRRKFGKRSVESEKDVIVVLLNDKIEPNRVSNVVRMGRAFLMNHPDRMYYEHGEYNFVAMLQTPIADAERFVREMRHDAIQRFYPATKIIIPRPIIYCAARCLRAFAVNDPNGYFNGDIINARQAAGNMAARAGGQRVFFERTVGILTKSYKINDNIAIYIIAFVIVLTLIDCEKQNIAVQMQAGAIDDVIYINVNPDNAHMEEQVNAYLNAVRDGRIILEKRDLTNIDINCMQAISAGPRAYVAQDGQRLHHVSNFLRGGGVKWAVIIVSAENVPVQAQVTATQMRTFIAKLANLHGEKSAAMRGFAQACNLINGKYFDVTVKQEEKCRFMPVTLEVAGLDMPLPRGIDIQYLWLQMIPPAEEAGPFDDDWRQLQGLGNEQVAMISAFLAIPASIGYSTILSIYNIKSQDLNDCLRERGANSNGCAMIRNLSLIDKDFMCALSAMASNVIGQFTEIAYNPQYLPQRGWNQQFQGIEQIEDDDVDLWEPLGENYNPGIIDSRSVSWLFRAWPDYVGLQEPPVRANFREEYARGRAANLRAWETGLHDDRLRDYFQRRTPYIKTHYSNLSLNFMAQHTNRDEAYVINWHAIDQGADRWEIYEDYDQEQPEFEANLKIYDSRTMSTFDWRTNQITIPFIENANLTEVEIGAILQHEIKSDYAGICLPDVIQAPIIQYDVNAAIMAMRQVHNVGGDGGAAHDAARPPPVNVDAVEAQLQAVGISAENEASGEEAKN